MTKKVNLCRNTIRHTSVPVCSLTPIEVYKCDNKHETLQILASQLGATMNSCHQLPESVPIILASRRIVI